MDNLNKLMSKCEYGINISINTHKGEDSIKGYVTNYFHDMNVFENVVLNQMVMLNKMVIIFCYPKNTKVRYTTFHYDLDKAINELLDLIEEDGI